MAVHSSSENILLDVTYLVIYNFICLIITVSVGRPIVYNTCLELWVHRCKCA